MLGLRSDERQEILSYYFFLSFFFFLTKCCICKGLSGQWHPTPVLLPGKSHGWRSLVGCSPWGRKESDMTEQLQFHFSLSCIGEDSSNPLQCSCLENPRDGGAWWAAVYGVAQSRTWLKRLSSSSSSIWSISFTLKQNRNFKKGKPLSLVWFCDPTDYTVHGILQVGILE